MSHKAKTASAVQSMCNAVSCATHCVRALQVAELRAELTELGLATTGAVLVVTM